MPMISANAPESGDSVACRIAGNVITASVSGKKCRIVCDSVKVHTASSEVQTLYTDGAAEFDTETGKTYTLTF